MKKVLLVGALLIIIVVALGYFSVRIPGTQQTTIIMSPKEVYLALKTEAANVKDFAGMAAVYRKYLTDEFFQENNFKLQSIPADQREEVFEALKARVVPLSDIRVDTISESITGNDAVIIAYTKDNEGVGLISVVKENGAWKVSGPEDWVSSKIN